MEFSCIHALSTSTQVRTGKKLHDEDERDEQRLTNLVFLCLRAGMLDKAKEMCVEMGQPWRAATLVGWELAHDPNKGGDQGQAMDSKSPGV